MFVALPAFAEMIGGVSYYGMLQAVMTTGMLAGTIYSNQISKKLPIGKLLVGCSIYTGSLAIIGFFLTQRFIYLGLVMLLLSGFPWGISLVLSSTITQKMVPKNILVV